RWKRGKYRVAVAVGNLTGKVQAHQLDMMLPGVEGVGIRMGVRQRTLREEDASATLAADAAKGVAACLFPWDPLVRGGGDPAIMAEWRRLAEREPGARRRADYAGVALVFAELTKRRPEWEQALEDFNVYESVTANKWRQEGSIQAQRKYLLRA